MTITLEAVKAEQAKLAEMIAKLEAQAKIAASFPITLALPDLKEGERYVGAIISADGKKREHIILLSGERESTNWKDAMEWAKSIGGELPDRVESALLFATMKDEFKAEWYWTREQHASDSDFAWIQYFGIGYQYYGVVYRQDRARAVRRLIIQ